jgi:hypothetical protein
MEPDKFKQRWSYTSDPVRFVESSSHRYLGPDPARMAKLWVGDVPNTLSMLCLIPCRHQGE